MTAIADFRRAPETSLLVGLLAMLVVVQNLLPLPVHTRLDTDAYGHWTLVCRWLDQPPNDTDHDRPRAPGMVFSSLVAELLAPGDAQVAERRWFSVLVTSSWASPMAISVCGLAHRIRGPPT